MTDVRAQQIEILYRDGYHCAAKLLAQPPTVEEFNYLLDFVSSGEFWGEPCCFQLRALWTAYCLHADLDVDTGKYDSQLMRLWEAFTAPSWQTFEHFDQFMCAYLV